MANSFFFLNSIDGLRDPVRSTRWRVLIPNSIFKASGIKPTNGLDFAIGEEGMNNFALHVKTCQIPEISLTEAKHFYMGFGSSYPMGADISAQLPFTAILLEDMRAYEAMIGWEQACLNTGILVDNAGKDRLSVGDTSDQRLGLGQHKDGENDAYTSGAPNVLRNSDIKVQLYNWMNGDVILTLTLVNSYPLKVGGVDGFNYEATAKIQTFNFTLQCDRWTLQIPDQYKTGTDGFSNER